MKKASESRPHADESRTLAARMDSGEHRDQLLEMAATWDRLADERAQQAKRRPERAGELRNIDDTSSQ